MPKALVALSMLHALSFGTDQFSGLEFVEKVLPFVLAHVGCLHKL